MDDPELLEAPLENVLLELDGRVNVFLDVEEDERVLWYDLEVPGLYELVVGLEGLEEVNLSLAVDVALVLVYEEREVAEEGALYAGLSLLGVL